ncbi:hypothetical protein HU200_059666 [Digitaria exilis]|uniref:PIR2-like helical domain-containing protein n=1 Tax=Digitaria exilis TaxID=1010633 RepID=A0A835DZJ1_9POAL|nr:hypothetical protein HU200_059666 [Digitaria exilis]
MTGGARGSERESAGGREGRMTSGARTSALRYLRLAGSDLLVAARIVASDVGIKRFDEFASRPAATESLNMALKCAALAAGADDLLVDGWHEISTHADEVLRLLGLLRGTFRRSSSIGKLARLVLMLRRRPQAHADVDLWWAWQLAAGRSIRPSGDGVPFRHTPLLIRTLQDAIHGFYLQALARLPSGELRSRFHRSLLKGGHCYGPLDPVSNIIVNTVWYDAAFPRTHELDMDVIGTRSMHRLENQSLYGMASFLCTRYHSIDFHEAVCFLLEADANLLLADPNLDPEGTMASVYGMWGGVLRHGEACLFNDQDHLEPDTGVQEAFLAAAMAAQHCNPDAQVKLLTSCKEMLGPALSLLQGGGKLSSEDVHRLAMLLCPESPRETKPLLPLPLTGYPRAEVADAHTRITKKVRAVLNSYEQMPNGVAQNRCLYCEFMGIRIVHPVGINFHGRELEFEKMACGEDTYGDDLVSTLTQPFYSNLKIISDRCLMADNVRGRVKEDSLYDDVDGQKRERILSSKNISAADALFLVPCSSYV